MPRLILPAVPDDEDDDNYLGLYVLCSGVIVFHCVFCQDKIHFHSYRTGVEGEPNCKQLA